MKTLIFSGFIATTLLLGFSSCKPKDVVAASTNGTATATINGTAWTAANCGALIAGSGTQVSLVITIEKNPKDNTADVISLGVNYLKTETGIKTYTIGSNTPVGLLNAKYMTKSYGTTGFVTGVSGTIKITENTAPVSLLQPGKVVGEFSGTLKTSDNKETLTITNGTFTAVRVF